MKKGNLFAVGALALLGSSLALAGNLPCVASLTVGDGFYHFSSKHKIQDTTIPNLALAYNFTEHWAIEGGIGLINTDTTSGNIDPKTGVHGFLYTVDGLYRFCPYWNLQPYLSAGIGVLGLKPNGTDSEHQGNVNVGVGAQWWFYKTMAFRAEARDFYTMTGGKNDYMINLGMTFLLVGCC